MSRCVCIIHSSPVIREGLAVILKRHFKNELYLYENLKSINFNPGNALLIAESNIIKELLDNHVYIDSERIVLIEYLKQLEKPYSADSQILKSDFSEELILETVGEYLDGLDTESNQSSQDELTGREQDVLRLIAMGHSNKEIAEKLFISIHTVITHRKNITEKLGIKSISGLTVYAMINKLIVPEGNNFEKAD